MTLRPGGELVRGPRLDLGPRLGPTNEVDWPAGCAGSTIKVTAADRSYLVMWETFTRIYRRVSCCLTATRFAVSSWAH